MFDKCYFNFLMNTAIINLKYFYFSLLHKKEILSCQLLKSYLFNETRYKHKYPPILANLSLCQYTQSYERINANHFNLILPKEQDNKFRINSFFKSLDIKNIEKNINKFKKLESLKFDKEFLFKSKPNKYVVYNHKSCKNF